MQLIEALTEVPLIIHGGSGLPVEQWAHLARNSNICKYNIGTELRQAFGRDLRDQMTLHPERFDRVEIMADLEKSIVVAVRRVLSLL